MKYGYSKKAFVFTFITDVMDVTPSPTEQCYYLTDNNRNHFELRIEPKESTLHYNDIKMKYAFTKNDAEPTPAVEVEYDETTTVGGYVYVYEIELAGSDITAITFTLYEHDDDKEIESFTYEFMNLTLNSDRPVYSFVDDAGKGSFVFPQTPQCTMEGGENVFRFDEDNVEVICALTQEENDEKKYTCEYDYGNEDRQYGKKTVKTRNEDVIGDVFAHKQFQLDKYTVSCESNENSSTVVLRSNEFPLSLITSISIRTGKE